jgi:hypothetical protein
MFTVFNQSAPQRPLWSVNGISMMCAPPWSWAGDRLKGAAHPADIWSMSIVIPFPLIAPNDDGIRPAGGPDKCFYCGQKIGTSHLRNCVAMTKKVKLRVTLDVELDQPHFSDPTGIESYFEEEQTPFDIFVRNLH